LPPPVKILERNEVVQQSIEVAMETNEFVHGSDRVRLRFEGLVFRDERGDDLSAVAVENLAHSLEAKFLDASAGLAPKPSFVTCKPRCDCRPIRLRQSGYFT